MKLRLSLVLFCLLGIGLFARAQNKKKLPAPPRVETLRDAPRLPPPPAIGKSHNPQPPPQVTDEPVKELPAPKISITNCTPPRIIKRVPPPQAPKPTIPETLQDLPRAEPAPPAPKPAKIKGVLPRPDAPLPIPERAI